MIHSKIALVIYSYIQGVMSAGGYVRRGFCPQGVLFRGLCPQGVLSAGGYVLDSNYTYMHVQCVMYLQTS